MSHRKRISIKKIQMRWRTSPTQKGALHKINPTFKSVPGNVTPAEYRRKHMGDAKKKIKSAKWPL